MNPFSNQGVVVPKGQRREPEKVTPNKVGMLVPVQQYAVAYGDEHGNLIKEIWYKVGDQWYQPKGSEEFTSTLGPVKDSLAQQSNELLAARDGAPEIRRGVDIVDAASQATAQALSTGVDV